MNWKIKILLLLFLCTGCSIIDKSLYLKSVDKNNGWIRIKNKNYTHNFPFKIPIDMWSCYQYYSCDSSSSLALFFSNIYYYKNYNKSRECVSVGPPFLPIFPLSIIDGFTEGTIFTIQINVNTFNYEEIDSLINHIHFIFNGTLHLLPFDTKIIKNSKYTDNLHDGIVCNKSHINTYYSVTLKFKKGSIKLKKLSIDFDKEFNHQLKSNFKTLDLIKKNRYCYKPL